MLIFSSFLFSKGFFQFRSNLGENIIIRSGIITVFVFHIAQSNINKSHIQQLFVAFTPLEILCVIVYRLRYKFCSITIKLFFLANNSNGKFRVVNVQSYV